MSDSTPLRLATKLRQAEFFCGKLNSRNDFEIECYFVAYLAVWKSICYYIERQMPRQAGRKTKKSARTLEWLKSLLSTEQFESWQVLTRLRDEDVHAEPIQASTERVGGFDLLDLHSLTPPFSMRIRFMATDPETGNRYEIRKLANVGISVAQRMIAERHLLDS